MKNKHIPQRQYIEIGLAYSAEILKIYVATNGFLNNRDYLIKINVPLNRIIFKVIF